METTTTTTTVTTVTKSTTVTTMDMGGEGWAVSKKNQIFKTVKNLFSKASKWFNHKQITNGEHSQRSMASGDSGGGGAFYSQQVVPPMTPARIFARKIKKSVSVPSSISSKPKSTSTTATSSSLFTSDEDGGGDIDDDRSDNDGRGGEFWKRSILMGEKCDPLNFSGAIFYDSDGRITDNKGSNPRTNSRRKLPSPPAARSEDYY